MKMKTKNKSILFLLFLINLITVSCQSKSEKINLNILDQPSQNIISDNQVYPLRYHNFVDNLHTRVVLKDNQIDSKWQPFNNENFTLDYMNVYFNKDKTIGFKGYLEVKSKNNSDEIYKNLCKLISSDNNFKQVDLINNDKSILYSEWESNNIIIGAQYEKPSNSIALITIYKNELSSFYDKIFQSEFLNLTEFRSKNSQIKFKELKSSSSKSDKDFYEDKFKELKSEYNKK